MNRELESLQDEVQELRRTVQQLRTGGKPGRTARLLLVALGLVLGLIAAQWLVRETPAVAQENEAKDLVCKTLRVLGPNGKVSLVLGTDDDGGIMSILGRDGNIRTIVAVAPKQGGGLINLFDTQKKIRLLLQGGDEGGVIERR